MSAARKFSLILFLLVCLGLFLWLEDRNQTTSNSDTRQRVPTLSPDTQQRVPTTSVVPGLASSKVVSDVASVGSGSKEFKFQSRETVVFCGDSVTFAGLYPMYVEMFLRSRLPEIEWQFINAAMPKETLADLLSANQPAPFPNASDRFTRDVAAHKPTLIIACYGMYDGAFASFDEGRFAKFRQGVETLIERTRKETSARLILVTPPVFDHPKAGTVDERALSEFSQSAPFVNYDQVLTQYSGWLMGTMQGRAGVWGVDLHTHTRDVVRARRRTDEKFTLQPDRVHPNATGQMVMAAELIRWLRVPRAVEDCVIDAAAMKAVSRRVSGLAGHGGGIEFNWGTKLPMTRDTRWDAAVLAMEEFSDQMNRYQLKISGLAPGEYQLVADENVVAHLSAGELAAGVDLLQLKGFPTHKIAVQAFEFIDERRKLEHKLKLYPPAMAEDVQSELNRMEALNLRIKQLCEGKVISMKIAPVK